MSIEDGKYDVSNPHPDYGKDPNILNEFGHTAYPKWVEHPTDKNAAGFPARVLVEDEKAEQELLGKRPIKQQMAQQAPGWTK